MAPSVARFAHVSEAELARVLDFYRVDWQYEPRTFPLVRNERGDVVEAFTPDFYLPEFNMYIEVTVLSPRLQSRKNRKIRLLRERYPDVRIKLFARRDVERFFSTKLGRAS
ncbi:MAG: hypothetical protein M3Y18_04480 [Candidatus Eremiobacteraeota bacterium]|nr:hypothetical protein [Candidatus Eremiobacteraeota bacterium]